jgi:hypothetical protein
MEHPIRTWCARQSPPVRIGDFAKRLGISRIHLGRLMRAEGNFKLSTFEEVERATGGDLQALSLIAHFHKQRELAQAVST